eukprot:TRINITY_DN6587_c0_g1_i1.p1 TRINITY_DN6587_c0_g1~~TRINITY_DN6587_c0_g1_i1.p1  ORF type:complete len:200 (+),score=50.26 TRINITY_DN6587_c0_g1_i1:91-600(+)
MRVRPPRHTQQHAAAPLQQECVPPGQLGQPQASLLQRWIPPSEGPCGGTNIGGSGQPASAEALLRKRCYSPASPGAAASHAFPPPAPGCFAGSPRRPARKRHRRAAPDGAAYPPALCSSSGGRAAAAVSPERHRPLRRCSQVDSGLDSLDRLADAASGLLSMSIDDCGL